MSDPQSLELVKLEHEQEKLRFERERFEKQNETEKLKIKWISGVVAVVVAVLSTASGITIAVIEYIANSSKIRLDYQQGIAENNIKSAEQQRLFLETFATNVMNGDLAYRRDFAFYVSTVSTENNIKDAWTIYLKAIEKEIEITEIERSAAETQVARLQSVSEADEQEIARISREINRLTRALEGGTDIRTRQAPALDPDYLRGYLEFMEGQDLKYFQALDFLVSGRWNSDPSSPAFGLNTPPPPEIWPNIAKLAKVMEGFRERHGSPVRIISAYRSVEYNAAIASASRSQHLTGLAVDFSSTEGTPAEWAQLLRTMRDEGVFSGGIGLHNTFVHVDARGVNADWQN